MGGGSEESTHFSFKNCLLLSVAQKRKMLPGKTGNVFRIFSKLPFQNKCKYEYSTLRRIFLMPKKIHLNTKGFAFSLIWKGI